MADDGAFYRLRPVGVDLFVRLTPRSSSDAIDGLAKSADGAVYFAVKVRAVPEKGAANEVLERLLAHRLGVAKRSVRLTAGATSRLKTVHVEGDPATIVSAIESVLAGAAN